MDVVMQYAELQNELDEFRNDVLKANTNKSANRRARKTSVSIRKTLKKMREHLLLLEKGTP